MTYDVLGSHRLHCVGPFSSNEQAEEVIERVARRFGFRATDSEDDEPGRAIFYVVGEGDATYLIVDEDPLSPWSIACEIAKTVSIRYVDLEVVMDRQGETVTIVEKRPPDAEPTSTKEDYVDAAEPYGAGSEDFLDESALDYLGTHLGLDPRAGRYDLHFEALFDDPVETRILGALTRGAVVRTDEYDGRRVGVVIQDGDARETLFLASDRWAQVREAAG